MALSQSRFQQLHQGLSSAARKVYAVVPVAEAWTFQQIHHELQRQSIGIAWNIMQGCVGALKEAGLVKEPQRGMFIREPVKAAQEVTKTENEPMPEIQPNKALGAKRPTSASSPTDRLGALAARVRTMSDVALQLHHEAVRIADDLDDVAVSLEENSDAAAKAVEKLNVLKSLFKD